MCRRGSADRALLIVETGQTQPRYIINFPTKQHWKNPSVLADIQAGLDALLVEVQRLNIRSIAVPALGCGLGGLSWEQVRPLIEQVFAAVPDVQVQLFARRES